MIDMNNEKIIRGHLEGFMPVKISCYKCGDCNKVMEQKTYRTSAKRDLYTHSLRSGFKMTENGHSMIEMLGVLAIIGVFSVGGIAGYSKAMVKFKINKTLQQIATIMTNSATLYVNKPENYGYYFWDNNYCKAHKTNCPVADLVMPEEMKKCDADDCGYYSVFGGDIELGNVGGDKEGYWIVFYGLPTEACIGLATQNYGNAGNNVTSVAIKAYDNSYEGEIIYDEEEYINGYGDDYGDEKAFIAYTHGPYCPIPVAKATEICSQCAEDNDCAVTITMF